MKGHHHLHHNKKPSTPLFSKPTIKTIDNLCLFFSVAMPLTTIPQILKIYIEKNVAGISLTMWLLYTTSVIPFLLYGIAHKQKPIIILNLLWLIAEIVIIVGILIYR